MRASVFADRALAKQAGRFAWLAINTDVPRNAAFLEMYAMSSWPTYFVLDPATERVVAELRGSATVSELEAFLDDADRKARQASPDPAAQALVRAERLVDERKLAEAAASFIEALRLGGEAWPRRAYVLLSLVSVLDRAGDAQGCAQVTVDLAPNMPHGPSLAAAAAEGLSCALSTARAPWTEPARAALAPLVEEGIAEEGVLADDRCDLYATLDEEYERRGDATLREHLHAAWAAFLDDHAAHAPNPENRSSLDACRVTLALHKKDPARAIPALLASERDLPADYLPPRRLSMLYRELGRLEDALAASDRALGRAGRDNPMRIQLLDERATLLEKKGDRGAARALVESALADAARLPPNHYMAPRIERIRAHLAELSK